MVVISRRGSNHEPLPLCRTPISGQSRSSFSFGVASPRSQSFIHADKDSWSNSRSGRSESRQIIIKSIYGMAFLSWVVISVFSSDYTSSVAAIDKNARVIKAQMIHMIEELKALDGNIKQERQHLKTIQKAKSAIDHEIRFYTEVENTTGQRINPSPRSGNEKLIKSWLEHRTDSLIGNIYKLQRRLQQDSKKAVIERYGEGPHKVEFTVDIEMNDGVRAFRSFIVETAPLGWMPISINLFLDMISGGIWDNTIFLHHEEIEHIMAAAPVDFHTEKVKHNQLSQLGWIGLGFPEYTEKFPHSQYTLAFAGQGTTFYINTMDNEESHGPGRQPHHLLPNDADPCFAKVVEGFDVVDELIRFGLKQKRTFNKVTHDWADAADAWTQIVSVRILNEHSE